MKRKIMLLFFVMIILIVCGCSPASDDSSNTDSKSSKSGDSEMSLSEAFSTENDSIWYHCYADDDDDVGKDTLINKVFIFKDGEFTVCERVFMSEDDELYGLSLGDVAKMSDDEVITMVKNAEEKKKSDQVTQPLLYAKNGCDYLFSQGFFDKVYQGKNGTTYDYSSIKGVYEEIRKSIENYKYKDEPENYGFAIYTDNTGNTTDSETIAYTRYELNKEIYQELGFIFHEWGSQGQLDSDRLDMLYYYFRGLSNPDIVSKATTIKSQHISKYIDVTGELQPSSGVVSIYEANYVGYSTNGLSEGGAYLSGVLLTKSTGKKYVLDEVGAKGVVVDPPEESDILGEQTTTN